MDASDQFHLGIVVEDLDATLASLSDLFGYEWCEEFGGPVPVTLPTGETLVDLRFAYSKTQPRLEIIRSRPGTPWTSSPESSIHHLGYWSDDLEADAARLVQQGFQSEAAGVRPDGTPYWAYHRRPGGLRIELVSRELEPGLTKYWTTGTFS
jgi:hypothetical protein